MYSSLKLKLLEARDRVVYLVSSAYFLIRFVLTESAHIALDEHVITNITSTRYKDTLRYWNIACRKRLVVGAPLGGRPCT